MRNNKPPAIDIFPVYLTRGISLTGGTDLDSCFVVLTNNENLTFEEVSKSLYSSSFEDIKVMEGSLIVEMIY